MCTKISYDKKTAITILNYFNKRGRKRWRKEKRYYYCEGCKAWHLTSMEEEEVNNLSIEIKGGPFEQYLDYIRHSLQPQEYCAG